MYKLAIVAALLAFVAAQESINRPLHVCRPDDMFIADMEDLCKFHWCVEVGIPTVELRCAPGSRVPTWFVDSSDHEVPCNVDRREEVSCLRCDVQNDVRLPGDDDDCENNPCGGGCTCQDLWRSFYCMCPDSVVPTFDYVSASGDYCDPDQCQNGASCLSQWDDYWCECLNGWTGKNCEVSFCDPNPCMNGGTCVIDEVNYHCLCVDGFTGACCDNGEPARVATSPTVPPTTTPSIVECGECEVSVDGGCGVDRRTCACYPCDNYGDECTDGVAGGDRTCVGIPNLSGTPFSIVFMQNRPDDTENRELEIYVTAAGDTARQVRVWTEYVAPSSNCYFEQTKQLVGFAVERFTVPNAECNEQKGSRIYNDRMIKVEAADGKNDLLVYAVNRDQWSADAWIAYPDARAATEFYTISYGPPTFGTQFSVLALQDDTEVTFDYQPAATPNLRGSTFNLNAGESIQIQSEGDLTGTRIRATKPVHAWSGNIRALITEVIDDSIPDISSGSRDHLVEHLIPVDAWGYEYNIVPIPNRIFGDHIRVLAATDGTQVTVYRNDENGMINSQNFTLDSGKFAVFDALSGNSYRVESTEKIMVAQITKSKDREESSNDPSLILIPAVAQYSNRYLFSTPNFSGGAGGSSRPYNSSLALISARNEDRNGITISNRDTGNSFSLAGNEEWKQVPGSEYWNVAVEIQPGTNTILHQDQKVSFMCIYYGFDDRESLGFPIGMLLYSIP